MVQEQQLPNSIKEAMERTPDAFQPDKAAGVTATIQYKFTGAEPGSWTVRVADGKCSVEEGNTEHGAVGRGVARGGAAAAPSGAPEPMTTTISPVASATSAEAGSEPLITRSLGTFSHSASFFAVYPLPLRATISVRWWTLVASPRTRS